MTTTALCQFMQVLNGSAVEYSAQNYFIGETVEGHPFQPFVVGATVATSGADSNETNIAFPYSQVSFDFFTAAFQQGWVVDLSFKQFTPVSSGMPSMTVIARFVGEIVQVNFNLTQITLRLGSAMDPIAAQIPPRKFATALTGNPPRL